MANKRKGNDIVIRFICRRLKEIRLSLGLRMSKVAERVGLSPTAISDIENKSAQFKVNLIVEFLRLYRPLYQEKKGKDIDYNFFFPPADWTDDQIEAVLDNFDNMIEGGLLACGKGMLSKDGKGK